MMSEKCSDFFYPHPLVMYIIQATLFLLSAFWVPPPPTHCRHHIWKPPYVKSREKGMSRTTLSSCPITEQTVVGSFY